MQARIPDSMRKGTEESANPWDALFSGLGIFGWRRRRRFWFLLVVAVATLHFVWLLAGVAGEPGFAVHLAVFATVMLVTYAFLAPSLGAQARRTFDRSPLLVAALSTPAGSDEVCIALRRGLRRLALHGFLFATLTAGTVLLVQALLPGTLYGEELRTHPVTFVVAYVSGAFLVDPDAGWRNLLLVPAFAAAAANYAAGIYRHSTRLAMLCQLDPRTLARGGVLTGGLVLWTIFLQPVYFVSILMAAEAIKWFAGQPAGGAPNITSWAPAAMVVFGVAAVARAVQAEAIWRGAAPTEVFETTRAWACGETEIRTSR